MTILEFTCLREGFTPSQLGLPDSVLEGAGKKPLEDVRESVTLYRTAYEAGAEKNKSARARYHARKSVQARGATA